ncbi:hypothetical protein AV530_008492 [Patagioenas fasciata monilis]|uniref:Uncharacterized protein n=1 Tax=Patagioenas fasciata monilis TaxID=372326 RepID=A0A1V4L176_PATFA|nr:hypothetical protein AV530_008492 [Patagioenas fasciata monilis]
MSNAALARPETRSAWVRDREQMRMIPAMPSGPQLLVSEPWVNGSSSPSVRHEKCPEQMEAERNLFRSAVLLC